jgi:choline dehydrogenase-like flavoprotein
MSSMTPQTVFTRDVLGRYVCNTFTEAAGSGPFDVVIIGGGTFGLALAQDLFDRGRLLPAGEPTDLRILVLEAGPLVFLEHVQDIPNLQIAWPTITKADPATLLDAARGTPGTPPIVNNPPNVANPLAATRQELSAAGLGGQQPLLENWGLPWNSPLRFGGLAYSLGGRSLYFGGWSPRYLGTEMETAPADPVKSANPWPATVVDDLTTRFFLEAAQATGVDTSNAFINGPLHDYYRTQLFGMYGAIPDAVPLAELPSYATQAPVAPPIPELMDAPLAVQIISRPGFFPFNKFSSVPLAITGARQAAVDSGGNDSNKRLMIVPNCHVTGLRTRTYTLATGATVQEVVGIDTGNGPTLDLSGPIAGNANRRPMVVLAMGAIESARMARLVPGIAGAANAGLIGANLMVHLRKNVQFTVPLPAAGPAINQPELTALLVCCRRNIGGTPAHFHCQITASALPAGSGAGRSDALLFQNVPDLDNFRRFRQMRPGEVDVSIRAVGEMLPNPQNTVTVPVGPPDSDEYAVPRATVTLTPRTAAGPGTAGLERQVMSAMDGVIDHLAQNLFGLANPIAATVPPDGLGTTFHESGTLRMGDDPTQSVVNADGQFHDVTNLYAGDASVLPTCGSANPVMNGIALRRRLAKRLIPEGDGGQPPLPFVQYPLPAPPPAAGTVLTLFDGTSLTGWRMAGRGTFHVVDGALQSVPSFALGLLWCTQPMPQNYRLELEFLIRTRQTNSGVFIRFANPDGFTAPNGSLFYNPAWSAVYSGFEVQIDNSGAGQPAGLAKHRTGAVYGVNYPGDPNPDPTFPPATAADVVNPRDALLFPAWNQYRIEVMNDVIAVNLNGTDTAQFTIPGLGGPGFPPPYPPGRGLFDAAVPTFIGLQSYSSYSDTTAFRNIRVTVL